MYVQLFFHINLSIILIPPTGYALIYFYGVNILKNLNRIFPKNRYIDFLYYVLSFEMIKKIPYLENYKQKQKDK